jgi:hypothetical protein
MWKSVVWDKFRLDGLTHGSDQVQDVKIPRVGQHFLVIGLTQGSGLKQEVKFPRVGQNLYVMALPMSLLWGRFMGVNGLTMPGGGVVNQEIESHIT